jgi:hypothetical protein
MDQFGLIFVAAGYKALLSPIGDGCDHRSMLDRGSSERQHLARMLWAGEGRNRSFFAAITGQKCPILFGNQGKYA